MAYIYKITNNINDKVYVGKTNLTVEQRFRQHCKDAFKERYENRPLYRAIRKYGTGAFSVSELEQCSVEVASERESFWIEKLGSFKHGYNATAGGDGKHYADYDLIYSLWKNGLTMRKIQEATGYSIRTIRTALEENNIGYEARNLRGRENNSKPVAMLDKDTEDIIKTFSSIREAQDFFGIKKGHIGDVCNGKRKTSYGYKWKYL